MQWQFLAGAISFEVGGTISLRMAASGRRAYYAAVAVGYLVAYGIWAASGVALTAVASRVLFREPLTPLMMGGIALIIGGVLLVEIGAAH